MDSTLLYEWAVGIGAPVLTGVLGWFGNAYRNRQRKEKDILDNVQQILDMKETEVARARESADRNWSAVERAEKTIARIEDKLDKRDHAIRQYRNCGWVKQGNECPIVEANNADDNSCKDCQHSN